VIADILEGIEGSSAHRGLWSKLSATSDSKKFKKVIFITLQVEGI